MVVAPEIRIAQAVAGVFFLGHFYWREFEKRFHGDHRIADVMAQAGREQTEADDAVGDHHVAEHGHFFVQQLVALGLHHEKFQGLLQRQFQFLRVPRLGDVFVNRAGVDGGDGGVHVRERRHEDAQGLRPELARALQQPRAFFAGHLLVGHQHADFIRVRLQQFQTVLGVVRGEHAKIIAERLRKIFQRFFLVVHIEHGEFFIVVWVRHGQFCIGRRPRHWPADPR